MDDLKKIEQAFDLLETAEVAVVFDNTLWVRVDRKAWEEFTGESLDEREDDECLH